MLAIIYLSFIKRFDVTKICVVFINKRPECRHHYYRLGLEIGKEKQNPYTLTSDDYLGNERIYVLLLFTQQAARADACVSCVYVF